MTSVCRPFIFAVFFGTRCSWETKRIDCWDMW